ncbi:MAG: aspartate/glutamate racemase family protein [Candidatus Aenigmarchaeota archaeon]|nr:aspartate/glutamate racemase family protein [Candidatus Aenigmarchaeota archaeon]
MIKIKIGVLGGIGPEASAEFYSKLVKKIQESCAIEKNTDFPQIIINSIPAPELIYDEIRDTDLLPYSDGLKELDKLGADFIVMVCNTIHLYYDNLQEKMRTPIIDLRMEVKKAIGESGARSMLILGTPSTIKHGLYKCDDIKNFQPNKKELGDLTNAIFHFNKGHEKEKQSQIVREICEKYMNMGAEILLLGCTEFAVMLEKEKFPKINTIDVLVGAVIDNLNKPQPMIKKK